MLNTQEEIELQMYHGGIERAELLMNGAEEKGHADRNPYARAIFDAFVLPLSQYIREDVFTPKDKAGVRFAHVQLLRSLNPDAVAFLACRTVLNNLLSRGREWNHRNLAAEIGRVIHCELVLAQLEENMPELYITLVRDLGRRLSRNERHRMTVFKLQAKRAGIEWAEWGIGSRDQVGLYLLGLLEDIGLVQLESEVYRPTSAKDRSTDGRSSKKYRDVLLTSDVLKRIDQVKAHIAVTSPVFGPCVAPPMDWTSPTNGGFLTRELRRTHMHLVRATGSTRDIYRNANMPIVLGAVNNLQRTGWRVNTRILDVVSELSKTMSSGEIVSPEFPDMPPRPACADKESMTPEEQTEFKVWKRHMATWYTGRKLNNIKYGRFFSATRAAEMFRLYPAIYFVYFADSRGRLYPMTYGLNPQGSDLQRGLLTFAEGKSVRSPDAVKWFKIHGANKWGFDKATLEERAAWTDARSELIYNIGMNPLDNREWLQADNPTQFLAWAMEYSEWLTDPVQFKSRIPVSMDGSCNGLQNLSAMTRDEIGGAATNLVPGAGMEDIYRRVAEAATARLLAADEPEDDTLSVHQRWVKHGISRSLVKRSVMTTPYGVTARSACDYIIEDYLRKGNAPEFEQHEYRHAAMYIMKFVWPAIGDVVVKGREVMAWLRKAAKVIVTGMDEETEPVIQWTSPSGFPATQAYFEIDIHRIRTRLNGATKIRVASESDDPDMNKHASGMAPNFVHSCDAAHLHLTTVAAGTEGIASLAMIHDDYGTHAADAEKLYRIIREQFVYMYENHDPLAEFCARYPELSEPPSKGTLDIRGVLDSKFFFS